MNSVLPGGLRPRDTDWPGGSRHPSHSVAQSFISLASDQTSSSATHLSVLYIDLGRCNVTVIGRPPSTDQPLGGVACQRGAMCIRVRGVLDALLLPMEISAGQGAFGVCLANRVLLRSGCLLKM